MQQKEGDFLEAGAAISLIRKEKNISIKDLCGDQISRSAYTRFVNGETDTSTSNFLFFLDKLHVSFNEFMLIKEDYQQTERELYLIRLQKYFLNGDVKNISILKKECELLSEHKNDIFNHLTLLCEVYLCRIKNIPVDADVTKMLKSYLMDVDTWTHYEILLFNNSMFIYDINFIEIVLNRATRGLDRYKSIRGYTNESFGMLTNVLNIYLSSKELHKANKLFKFLSDEILPEEFVRERLHLTFFEGIIMLVLHKNTDGKNKIDQVIKTCEFLNMTTNQTGYKNLYKFFSNLYGLS